MKIIHKMCVYVICLIKMQSNINRRMLNIDLDELDDKKKNEEFEFEETAVLMDCCLFRY